MNIVIDGIRYAPGSETVGSMDGYRDMVAKLEARQGSRPELSASGESRFPHLRGRMQQANIHGTAAVKPRAAAKATTPAHKPAPKISEADLANARALVAAGEVRREKERQAQLAVIAAGKVRRAQEREASIAASWKKVIATMNARTAPRRLHR